MAVSTAPPLTGIVVADFSNTRAELAGRLLAELGAEVIKVEPPGGAAARALPPFDESRPKDSDTSLYWAAAGAGKQSVVIDLEDPAACASLRTLLERADILIESFDPGQMARLGLSYADVSAFNPRVIYASVTPYGQDGPEAHSPATELTLEAAGGLLGLQGDADRPPVPVGYPQASFHSGIQAAADAVMALNERERSGLGQHLDVSMQAAMVWTLMNATGYPPNTGNDPPTSGANRIVPLPSLIPGIAFPRLWECADGYLTVTLVGGRVGKTPLHTVVQWAEADGLVPEAIRGRDWRTWAPDVLAGALPIEEAKLALEAVGAFFKRHKQHELMQMGTQAGLLLAPVLSVDGILSDPQLQARDYWVEVEGRKQPGIPARFSKTKMRPPAPAPKLGQHQAALAGPFPPRNDPRGSNPTRSRIFDGLKIADFAWIGVGPIVSKAFADHGATVIHVESLLRPDLLRTLPPFKDGVAGLDRTHFFGDFNSSKLGLNLNLFTPEGIALAKKLIDWADVVTESFTAGAFARLGFSYEALSRERPELVMFSTCLRGQSGPQCTYGGYGGQGASLAGIYGVTGWPDRAPHGPWGAYTDFIAPRFGVAALASALYHRQRTGEGQHIDLSQVEAALHFIEPLLLDYTVNGRIAKPAGHESPTASPHGVYRVRGVETYITIACETPHQWLSLRSVAPLEAFSDMKFDALANRLEHDAEIDDALDAWCADQDGHELAAKLKAAGVPAAYVSRPSDLYADPQLIHRDFFKVCEHSVMGPTPYDGPVTLFRETPPAYTAAPCLGEHTHQVLTDILGLTDEEVARYAEAGALQ